jgi:hypothetical protein
VVQVHLHLQVGLADQRHNLRMVLPVSEVAWLTRIDGLDQISRPDLAASSAAQRRLLMYVACVVPGQAGRDQACRREPRDGQRDL